MQVFPVTVSQLLAAPQLGGDVFAISNLELHQVSIVGVVRGYAPFVTHIQYSVDDMTGPPLTVKQWVNSEDGALMSFAAPGTYVKVIGSLRTFSGQRVLLAMNIRCIEDLNEITSHMMEVVKAHMQFFGKAFDVNMNTTAPPLSGGHPGTISPSGLSTSQGQVLHVVKRFSDCMEGISVEELSSQLVSLSPTDIRASLSSLLREGHIFSTTDDHHFRSCEC